MNNIIRLIQQHSKRTGMFHPFSYAIGLESTVEDYFDSIQSYPLSEPYTDDNLEKVAKSLVFIHEYTHLIQYLSTSFGLRCLRSMTITLNRLSKREEIIIPVLDKLWKSENQNDYEDLNRFIFFIETFHQLKIHKSIIPDNLVENYPIVWFEEFTPFFYVRKFDNLSGKKFIEKNQNWLTIKKLPHLFSSENGNFVDIVITPALLMETFVVLAEANHINNALVSIGSDITALLSTLFEILPDGAEYTCIIEYAYSRGIMKQSIIPLLICIDISLMYDPLLLYDINTTEHRSEAINKDVYPGFTFINVCEIARKLDFKSHEDTEKFYRELCEAMKFPTLENMVKMAFDHVTKLLNDNSQKSILHNAIVMHRDVLELRLKSPYDFVLALIRRDGIWNTFPLVYKFASFFSVQSKKPLGNYTNNLNILTCHLILFQILTESTLKCPLKSGVPFKCSSSNFDRDTYCGWYEGDKTRKCPLIYIEELLGINWENEPLDDDDDDEQL